MSWNHPMEDRIREAVESGELDDQTLTGQPLSLSDYFATPEHLRVGYSVLKGAGYVPLEVELMKQMRALEQKLSRKPAAENAAKFRHELALLSAQLNLNPRPRQTDASESSDL